MACLGALAGDCPFHGLKCPLPPASNFPHARRDCRSWANVAQHKEECAKTASTLPLLPHQSRDWKLYCSPTAKIPADPHFWIYQ